MSIKSIFFLLFSSLALTACSSSLLQSPREQHPGTFIEQAEASQLLADKPVSTQQFKQLNFLPLDEGDSLYVPLTADSQVYNFASGKSFVQAYKLTKNVSKLKLTINSLIYDTVLAPKVMLLDSNFVVTRTISSDKFIYREAGMMNGDRLSAELTIFRPQVSNPANETYLLFYTTPKAMAGSTTIVHPAKAFARSQKKDVPNIPDPIIPHSAVGLIELDIEALGTESDSDEAYIPLMTTEQSQEPGASTDVEPAKVEKTKPELPEMTKEAEQVFNDRIQQAVAEQDMDKALSLVDEAEAAGSTTARASFIEAISKK